MLNFGGILKLMVGAYIGRVEGNYVVQNSMVVWVFEVFLNNRALLAKQVWKIIREPSSLMSKILKLDISKLWTLWMLN